MAANFSVWGTMGNQAYALPMNKLVPTDPVNQGYVLAWNTLVQALDYAPLGFDFNSGDGTLAANFGVSAGKTYKVGSIQVVGARITGWTAPTATVNRATFDPATVTLANLAAAVAALLLDLRTHGLIGT